MTLAAAQIQEHSYSAQHLATAAVVGGSNRAATAAMQMLGDFAHEMGHAAERTASLSAHFAKESAVQFSVSGLAFANVAGGDKAPASAPNNANVSNERSV